MQPQKPAVVSANKRLQKLLQHFFFSLLKDHHGKGKANQGISISLTQTTALIRACLMKPVYTLAIVCEPRSLGEQH